MYGAILRYYSRGIEEPSRHRFGIFDEAKKKGKREVREYSEGDYFVSGWQSRGCRAHDLTSLTRLAFHDTRRGRQRRNDEGDRYLSEGAPC